MFAARITPEGAVSAVQRVPSMDRITDPAYVEISDANARTLKDSGLYHAGTDALQWAYDVATETLSPIPDGRLTATWSRAAVNTTVGANPVTVQLTLSNTSLNAARVVDFQGAFPMRLSFVAGVADVVIGTDVPLRAVLALCRDFRVVSPLTVRVLDNQIRPAG